MVIRTVVKQVSGGATNTKHYIAGTFSNMSKAVVLKDGNLQSKNSKSQSGTIATLYN
jgi:hypothetical protein